MEETGRWGGLLFPILQKQGMPSKHNCGGESVCGIGSPSNHWQLLVKHPFSPLPYSIIFKKILIVRQLCLCVVYCVFHEINIPVPVTYSGVFGMAVTSHYYAFGATESLILQFIATGPVKPCSKIVVSGGSQFCPRRWSGTEKQSAMVAKAVGSSRSKRGRCM